MTAPAEQTPTARFEPGSTAVRRDIHAGRVWTAMPHRVIDDTGEPLQLAYWPGITSLAPTTWIASLHTGDTTLRESGLHNLATGTWTLAPYRWTGTALRSTFQAGEHSRCTGSRTPARGFDPLVRELRAPLPPSPGRDRHLRPVHRPCGAARPLGLVMEGRGLAP
ncbi:hypothetical protein [Streptomyces sp. CB01881]|uniref:hypothetical protein n=1 Tax=Streptomyces sp. CB01881 TaxID=2078691 RepID=UPI0011E00D82|nr:hypothetical protein [Streptomyces sp. CB01881]TYC68630.1 hypothetical protein EH183_37705 [Streptomyces sp. CB01881]